MENALLTVAGLPVTSFGAGVALSALVFLCAMGLALARQKLGYGVLVRYAVLALPLGFVLSRLFFVAANYAYYFIEMSNPLLTLYFWDGGYSASGALCGLLLAAPLCARWTKQSTGRLLDAAAWAALPALIVERLCEGLTDLGLGRTISYEALNFLGVDDGMGGLVHPVYRYEAVLAAVILLAVTAWVLLRRTAPRSGDVCLVILTLLGATQPIMESLRGDGHMIIFHFVRVQQILFLGCAVAALWIFASRCGMKKSRQLLLGLVVVACIGVGILMEFRVDRGELKWLYYLVLSLCMAVIAGLALHLRRVAERLHR